MEPIRLALSPKQHASLRRGRKVRVNAKHCCGSGVQYIVHPETFDRLSHCFSQRKGMDLALDPTELQASMLGGGLTGNLRRAKKVLGFMGETYQAVAHEVAPVTRPVFEALSDLAVQKVNNAANPSDQYLNAAQNGVNIFQDLIGTSGPTTDTPAAQQSMVQLATVAALSNAFSPAAPAAEPVGTYTAAPAGPTFRSNARNVQGYGLHYLTHRPGTFQAPGAPLHPLHAARISSAQHVGFMQQLLPAFKGSGLYL